MFSLIRFIRSIDVKYFESLFIQIKGIGRNSATHRHFLYFGFYLFSKFYKFSFKRVACPAV